MSRVGTLLDQARSQTGLGSFGEENFREGLEVLVRSLDEEAGLNEAGRVAQDGQIVHFLACRMQVEDWYARHPEIDEQEIVAPVIGLGLPRTGSTAFGCLLGEDPGVRVLRLWEAAQPCPPPETATEHSDPRIATMAAGLARQDIIQPRMKTMLPLSPTSPTECQSFMGYTFKSQQFMATAYIPSYAHWLNHEAEMVSTYRYVKRVLKLLQWRCPPHRWRLKNPSNSLFIDAVDEVFPDARFWMTHRDVAQVVPSVCDLYYEMAKPFTDHVDKLALGRQNVDFTALGQRRVIAFRDDKGQDARFFDIQFATFQADPMPAIAGLYEFLAEDLTDTAKTRMAAWWEASRRKKPAGDRTDPGDFGLDTARLHEVFRFYTDRYGVNLSRPAIAAA